MILEIDTIYQVINKFSIRSVTYCKKRKTMLNIEKSIPIIQLNKTSYTGKYLQYRFIFFFNTQYEIVI